MIRSLEAISQVNLHPSHEKRLRAAAEGWLVLAGSWPSVPQRRRGRPFAHIASGSEAGSSYELAWLGNMAYENVVATRRHDRGRRYQRARNPDQLLI